MNEHETIADIIAEMRRRKEMLENAAFNAPLCYSIETMRAQCEILDEFIENLEAAHKREVDKLNSVIQATVSRSDAEIDRLRREIAELKRAGNAAKLRDAVIETQSAIAKCMDILNKIPECGYNALIDDVADELCDLREDHIKTALAAPARNCDVGTAEEQAERFYNFCTEHSSAIHGMCNYNCPCIGFGDKCHCLCKWLQMPYEEGGAK